MELSFPVFFQSIKGRFESEPVYRARMLFEQHIVAEDQSLQRATTKLIRKAKKYLDRLGELQHHQALAETLFHRGVQTHRLKLKLDLRDRISRIKVFVVVIDVFDRRIAFLPTLPKCWFEVNEHESLESRTSEVLELFFREQIKSHRNDAMQPESIAIEGECWVSNVDVDVRTDQKPPEENLKKMLSLWSGETLNGATELDRVGRCLDWLYPDDLEFAIGRDDAVAQLDRLLSLPEKRPVLLVGGAQTGKTAIVHEVVRRRVERRTHNNSTHNNVWLLSPQRLISGMSYVGEWENRVLAIFREARKRNHVLLFDDILGLFRAGQSRDSNLCVADLLAEALHRRDMRVLGEMTAEAFDKLNSLNIAFADQFHVIRVQPTTDDETLRIAIQVMRHQEQKQKCLFNETVIPTVIQLQRQYVAQASFPGKAARFLKQLAVKFHHQAINRRKVLKEFRDTTGIALSLLNDRKTLSREDTEMHLNSRLVGQQRAIDACVDVVTTAKARLCAPGKPLSTMLFLGPTGVGKTECAKALSAILFSDPEKMLRFDLNEFKSAYSAARLVGTMTDPEGLLTSAVRQQPYCIILLDEIEKAHRDVFDILLQVTGEGRLTDALGRTTDFSNAVIIMTSNLGTQTSGHRAGFADGSNEHHYIQAARQFFRPEFFNRIDKIIPFDSLNRQQIARIADQMMQQVISREGLLRRRCILQIDADAIQRIVDDGYNPQLGARAMKRTIEQQFTQPVAAKLSSIRSDLPTIVRLSRNDEEQFDVQVRALENAGPTQRPASTPPLTDLITSARNFMSRVRREHLTSKPPGDIDTSGIPAELLNYYALDEQVNKITDQVEQIEQTLDEQRSSLLRPELPITGDRKPKIRSWRDLDYVAPRQLLKAINSVRDIRRLVDETVESFSNRESKLDPAVAGLLNQCALVETMLEPSTDHVWFYMRACGASLIHTERGRSNAAIHLARRMNESYEELFRDQLEFDIESLLFEVNRSDVVGLYRLQGSCVSSIVARECGTQLYCDSDGQLRLFQTGMFNADSSKAGILQQTIDDLRSSFAAGGSLEVTNRELVALMDSETKLTVLRMHDFKNRTIDFRTGHAFQDRLTGQLLFSLLIGSLELPDEFHELLKSPASP